MTHNPDTHRREANLEWFTHTILPGGRHICAVCNVTDPDAADIVLDENATRVMHAVLDELVLRTIIRTIQPVGSGLAPCHRTTCQYFTAAVPNSHHVPGSNACAKNAAGNRFLIVTSAH
jgi:hypothetical protein